MSPSASAGSGSLALVRSADEELPRLEALLEPSAPEQQQIKDVEIGEDFHNSSRIRL